MKGKKGEPELDIGEADVDELVVWSGCEELVKVDDEGLSLTVA